MSSGKTSMLFRERLGCSPKEAADDLDRSAA
jgi:hypothetical protein